MYLTCLHCGRRLQSSHRRYCTVLCKSAAAKQAAKAKLADDRHHQAHMRPPTYDLTDYQCYRLEARLASQEAHVFDGRGWSVKDGKSETGSANANELHESWADKGALLDVWEIRKSDRGRYGGIVITPQLAAVMTSVLRTLQGRTLPFLDGLDSPDFHLKLFADELDEAYRFADDWCVPIAA